MNKKVICFILFLFLVTTTVEAKPVVVGFKEGIDLMTIEKYSITNYTIHKNINAISTDINDSIYSELKYDAKVLYVENDAVVHTEKKVVQPAQEIDWGVYQVHAPQEWNNYNGSGTKISIVDTGINKKHPDLVVSGGVNLINNKHSNNWDDDNGHGTHVAGTIGALNNTIGVVGVAYDSELYAVKVLDSTGNGKVSDLIEGIEWSVENDMDIISLSLSVDVYSQALEDACDYAYDSDILLVAAAGNSGDGDLDTNDVEYPAKFDSVIAVAAIDSNNDTPIWSADGNEVELAAPGVSIYSTYLEKGYEFNSGTSMAAPFVSGVAALAKSKNPTLSAEEIRDLLVSNSVDLGVAGKDEVFGFGLVQAS